MLGNFADRSGNFATIAAIAMMPLIVAIGGAVDMARTHMARSHLQWAVDAAALAIAADDATEATELRDLAEIYIASNVSDRHIQDVVVDSAVIDADNRVTIVATGEVELTFLKIIGYDHLAFELAAVAERPNEFQIEVALVLDNTWSMNDQDAKGVKKITALKTAATALVDELITKDDGLVSIGIVPYANNVNVGLGNRDAFWLDVADDYSKTSERVCETRTTKTKCVQSEPKYACTIYIDGVAEQQTCGGSCIKSETETVAPYQSCSGGNTTHYKWYGCVGSRRSGMTHLNDGSPSERYPGFIQTTSGPGGSKSNGQGCLKPIVPLTKDKKALKAAIDGMTINIGSNYKPLTYIPAGLIWGQNMLSPSEPLSEALPYSTKPNENPRKIMILMTDGENTLRLNANSKGVRDGKHVESTTATHFADTNRDTRSICSYSKAKDIEIFTVALMLDDPTAQSLLQSCATDAQHAYDASDTAALITAFKQIAGSINAVRLVH